MKEHRLTKLNIDGSVIVNFRDDQLIKDASGNFCFPEYLIMLNYAHVQCEIILITLNRFYMSM
jgi:hypothetical protein